MGAIYRFDSPRVEVTPTAALSAGAVVKVGNIVGVATHAIAAGDTSYIQVLGEYDVDVSNVTASAGDVVTVAAKTLSGADVNVRFGYAVRAIVSTDTVARLLISPHLNGMMAELPEKIAKPTFSAAANGATGGSLTSIAATGASSWQVRTAATAAGLASAEASSLTVSSGSASLSGLIASTKYFVQIRAIGDGTDYRSSEWSDAQNFTTTAALTPTKLDAPTITATAASATSVTLAGMTNANATSWQYRQATSEAGLASASATDVTPTSGSATISSLTASTAYYWQVKAVGDGTDYSDSDWSTAATATTAES